METWNLGTYSEISLPGTFVQDNLSYSQKDVLRGLHFQNPHAQAKLVSVLQGEIFDVVVDLRDQSPTFSNWLGSKLSSENRNQLFIPEGFAHGFVVTSESALVSYKCTQFYHPRDEITLLWNDPVIAIDWPTKKPTISEKDSRGKHLKDIERRCLFKI